MSNQNQPNITASDVKEMQVGENLFIRVVQGSSLKEQDINAQEMDTTMFERLVENVRQRGALESLPYVHQPNGEGVMSIISGHHRAKAARMAGLTHFPVLVDTTEMGLSLIRAKQIAHNQLTGSPDEEILRQMIAQIDSVDDLLVTGLGEDMLPEITTSDTKLDLPSAEFDWSTIQLTFLPEQLERVDELAEKLADKLKMTQQDEVWVASEEQFHELSQAIVKYAHVNKVKNMGAVVDELVKMSLAALADEETGELPED